MEKRIELERRARKANQITELNLDNCRSTSIVGLTDEYTALESLSLINVGLTTLKGFPKLPNLKKLELSDNRISNGLHYLTTSPKLQSLNLSGNKIKDLETLKPLEEFKNLNVLDLFNNEVTTKIDNYREKIFEMLPSLKFLDGFDCHDVEATSEGEDDDEVNGNDSEDDVSEGGIGEDDDDSDDVEDDDEYASDSDYNGDVSLAEVYNEDLEEDNSDWEEGDGVEDDEDEDDEDDEDADGDANESTASAAGKEGAAAAATAGDDEPHARGKKRKHEG